MKREKKRGREGEMEKGREREKGKRKREKLKICLTNHEICFKSVSSLKDDSCIESTFN